MNQTYYTIITKQGAALLANATALGIPLKITQMAVGDGNGKIPKPNASQTQLVHEVRRAAVNTLFVDQENPNQIIAEQVIPETDGGWFIHEIGLFDDKGNLIAVGNCPATYKPKLVEGSGRTQVIRMVIIVDNTQSVELKIDPAVVLATRQYVDGLITAKMTAHEKTTNHPNATTKSIGFVQLNSAIDSSLENQAATPLAIKSVNDNVIHAHARINDVNNNVNYVNDRVNIITHKFQTDNYESRVYSGEENVYMVIRNDGILGTYSREKKGFVWYVNHDGWINGYITSDRIGGLDQFVRDRTPPVGVPMPWPQVHPPAGYFECNGSAFNKNQFPKLAAAYPSGKLPDLRGEFIRGWDNARGRDPYRVILSWQEDAIRNITGEFPVSFRDRRGIIKPPVGAFREIYKFNSDLKIGDPDEWGRVYSFDASRVVPTSHDNHPPNIAFMYIVKAE